MAIKRKTIQGTLMLAVHELQTAILDGWLIEDNAYAVQPMAIGGLLVYVYKEDGTDGVDDKDLIGKIDTRTAEQINAERAKKSTTTKKTTTTKPTTETKK